MPLAHSALTNPTRAITCLEDHAHWTTVGGKQGEMFIPLPNTDTVKKDGPKMPIHPTPFPPPLLLGNPKSVLLAHDLFLFVIFRSDHLFHILDSMTILKC